MIYKEELIQKMKDYFENDKKRIDHSLQVTNYAEELIKLSEEKEMFETISPAVIIYSAILHDIGIKNSEEKYNSAAAKYQEIEGPPVARDLLNSFPIEQSIIDEICEIIANHHSPRNIDTYNFKLLYDADWLVNLPDLHDLSKKSNQEIIMIIDKLYLTEVGKNKAKSIFLL